MATERIFHVALLADWEAAQRTGEYRISTRGRTLEEEGFLHASYAHQWRRVRDAFYADVEQPLLLLEIDPDRLGVPLVVEAPPGAEPGAEKFPHVYGPLPVTAVVDVRPLSLRPAPVTRRNPGAPPSGAGPRRGRGRW